MFNLQKTACNLLEQGFPNLFVSRTPYLKYLLVPPYFFNWSQIVNSTLACSQFYDVSYGHMTYR